MATTFAQLIARVADRTGRPQSRSGSAVYTEIGTLVNDAYQEVVLSGRLVLLNTDLTLDPGTADYDIVEDLEILDLDSIKYLVTSGNGPTTYAQPVTLDELIDARSALTVDSSTPYMYSLNGDLLSLFPTPGAGDSAVLWFYQGAARLVADDDEVDESVLKPAFHDLIVLRASAMAVQTLNKGKNQSGVQESTIFQAAYENRLTELKRWRNRRYGSRDQSVQVGPPRHPRYANDVYFSGGNR